MSERCDGLHECDGGVQVSVRTSELEERKTPDSNTESGLGGLSGEEKIDRKGQGRNEVKLFVDLDAAFFSGLDVREWLTRCKEPVHDECKLRIAMQVRIVESVGADSTRKRFF